LQSKEQEEKKKDTVLSVRETLVSKKNDSCEPEHAPETEEYPEDENEEDFDNRMRLQILRKRRELGDVRPGETSKTGSMLFKFPIELWLSKFGAFLPSYAYVIS
jgi:hypothetical protein